MGLSIFPTDAAGTVPGAFTLGVLNILQPLAGTLTISPLGCVAGASAPSGSSLSGPDGGRAWSIQPGTSGVLRFPGGGVVVSYAFSVPADAAKVSFAMF